MHKWRMLTKVGIIVAAEDTLGVKLMNEFVAFAWVSSSCC